MTESTTLVMIVGAVVMPSGCRDREAKRSAAGRLTTLSRIGWRHPTNGEQSLLPGYQMPYVMPLPQFVPAASILRREPG